MRPHMPPEPGNAQQADGMTTDRSTPVPVLTDAPHPGATESRITEAAHRIALVFMRGRVSRRRAKHEAARGPIPASSCVSVGQHRDSVDGAPRRLEAPGSPSFAEQL